MKSLAVNPFLPAWEYVPDGEPHVFEGRLWLFGSHEAFNGPAFCVNDYVGWSAPLDDLSDWRYEGVIYKKTQDPMNPDGLRNMYAPDVARGPDGRYYLYYTLDFIGVLSVAVADAPGGPYAYYGVVRFPDGRVLGAAERDIMQYDPGLLVDEDGSIHLYSGVCPNEALRSKIQHLNRVIDGAYHMELAPDMLTIRRGPEKILVGSAEAKDTPFVGHAFFEASSMRKVGGKYFFIYSSENNYELCYAISERPDGGFHYGGTIVSLGDVFLHGRTQAQALNYLGTTHGSIECVQNQWYVFYHRQTNQNQLSRQACAEAITILPDGRISQMAMTSCGLNGGPLPGLGTYEARIACNLRSKSGVAVYRPLPEKLPGHPYFTQQEPDNEQCAHAYIANMEDGSMAGFKYFQMEDPGQLVLRYRGSARGEMLVSTALGEAPLVRISITPSNDWRCADAAVPPLEGVCALYFTYAGEGALDFADFTLGHD